MSIAVIGSGLAATSAIKVLIARGVKPVVLDVGRSLDGDRRAVVERLSQLDPEEWSDEDRELISENPTVHKSNSLPQKLAFGSGYFYGDSTKNAVVEGAGSIPPFSYAKGGFSVGWGAAILPADDCDLMDWPIKGEDLQEHYVETLKALPYSACDDELSRNFPLFCDDPRPIRLAKGNRMLLEKLRSARLCEPDKLVFGQSRLLVRADDGVSGVGCKYCGYCMSGCVYGSIYKSNVDIDKMIAEGAIDYWEGALVQRLNESGSRVSVSYIDGGGVERSASFDRVFLAAGAVNSTRIVLQSKDLYQKKVLLQSRAGFVVPMFSVDRLPVEWPQINTQPGLFLEFKVDGLSDHWVHTQLSTPNELVYKKLGIKLESRNMVQLLKKKVVEHLVLAFCNMHSDHADEYGLSLRAGTAGAPGTLVFDRKPNEYTNRSIKETIRRLSSIGRKIGCYPLRPFVKNNTGSYHVGCTMPMREEPQEETDTNVLGNPSGWERIHVIDSSIFPSLPGTTIGLLLMANAARIASTADL